MDLWHAYGVVVHSIVASFRQINRIDTIGYVVALVVYNSPHILFILMIHHFYLFLLHEVLMRVHRRNCHIAFLRRRDGLIYSILLMLAGGFEWGCDIGNSDGCVAALWVHFHDSLSEGWIFFRQVCVYDWSLLRLQLLHALFVCAHGALMLQLWLSTDELDTSSADHFNVLLLLLTWLYRGLLPGERVNSLRAATCDVFARRVLHAHLCRYLSNIFILKIKYRY